jgi:hypothetical protein
MSDTVRPIVDWHETADMAWFSFATSGETFEARIWRVRVDSWHWHARMGFTLGTGAETGLRGAKRAALRWLRDESARFEAEVARGRVAIVEAEGDLA